MKQSLRYVAYCLVVIAISLCFENIGRAQDSDDDAVQAEKFTIATLRLVDVPGNHYVRVDFSDPLNSAADLNAANITLKFPASGVVIPATQIDQANTLLVPGFGSTVALIALKSTAPKPAPNDKEIEVTFLALHFAGGTTKTSVKATGLIYDPTNIGDLVDNTRKALEDAVANAKTPDEKNFAGLNITVPSGGGDSEGSGDIVFNRSRVFPYGSLIDRINFGVKLNKASEEKADPRHFEAGLTFRKTFLFGGKKLRELRDAINSTPRGNADLNTTSTIFNLSNGVASNKPEALINDLQKNFFRSLLFDSAMKFEGDVKGASIGNVSNLLYDGQLQLTTVSQAFANRTGFWNFRWIPFGVEAGFNLRNEDDPADEKNSLARIKTGLVFELYYQATEGSSSLLNRIEFDVQALDRYLFKRESALDEVTKKAVLTDKGNTYWIQSDAKFFFGPTTQFGRPGFRIGFKRGSLPPVYSFTKAFTFGVIFQSSKNSDAPDMSK
jgi:hypothetical protein